MNEATPLQLRAARNAVMLHALEELCGACAESGLQIIPIKGALLCALGVYAPGERDFADLDLVVRKKDLPPFKALLARLGYEPIADTGLDFLKAGPPDSFCRPALDLHAEPFQFAPDPALCADLLWKSASPIGAGSLKPSAEWMFLIACLNPLLHGACLPPQAVEDCRRLAAALPPDWKRMETLSKRLGLDGALSAALERLRNEGVPVPQTTGPAAPKLLRAAAGRSTPSRALQYILPAALPGHAVAKRLFPEREYFELRGLPYSPWQRIMRPARLAARLVKAIVSG